MVAGSSATALSSFNPTVTVDATTTLSSGGTNDWHGRAYTARRDDGVLVMIYRRGISHASAASNLNIKFSDDDGATWTAENTKLGGGAVSGMPMVPSTGNINAGEGMIITCPSGRLTILLWRVDGSGDWPEDAKGTEQSFSEDGGETWSAPAAVTFGNVSDQEHAWNTDDWFVFDGVIYTALRHYNADNPTDSYTSFCKSTDDGTTWERVANITEPGSDTHEVGLEYVGDGCIVALVGSFNNDETIQAISTDMGETWTTTNVTGTAANISRRHKLYTFAHLMGEPSWWRDNRLIASGFKNVNSGSGADRLNMLLVGRWNRSAKTVTWIEMFILDLAEGDGGYGDVFYAGSPGQFSSVNYKGSTAAAVIKQYDVTIDLA